MPGPSDSQLHFAEQALALAAAATESAHGANARQQGAAGSGEFQAVLLSLVTELKVDSREHRQKIEAVLVALAQGDGRMSRIELQGEAARDRLGAIESRLAVVERTGTDTSSHLRSMELRLSSIEAGNASGIQRAIKAAVDTARKPSSERAEAGKKDTGLTISTPVMVKILAVLGSIAVTAVGGYFALRQPPAPGAATSATAPTPTPVKP